MVGTNIPEYILNLPNEVISSPMAGLISKFQNHAPYILISAFMCGVGMSARVTVVMLGANPGWLNLISLGYVYVLMEL